MRSTTYFVTALALGLCVGMASESQAADASNRGNRPHPSFEQLDKNGDGRLVAAEVPDRAWQRLSRADTNKDNAVSKAEFDAAKAKRGESNRGERRPSFEQLDKNGDGKIIAAEVPARAWQHLSRADTNKDNAISKAEFEAALASRPARGRS